MGDELANVYVVVPAGNGMLVVPEPKVSVKIGSPEFPVQKPNWAFSLKTEIPSKRKIMMLLCLITLMVYIFN